MRTLGLLVGLLAISCLTGCPSDDGSSEEGGGESGSETAAETETDSGDTEGCGQPGVYGDCISGGDAACMSSGDPVCLIDNQDNPTLGVCGIECTTECDCWEAPATGDAPVVCKALVMGDPDKTCVLDCSGGATCPDDMVCNEAIGVCVFQSG